MSKTKPKFFDFQPIQSKFDFFAVYKKTIRIIVHTHLGTKVLYNSFFFFWKQLYFKIVIPMLTQEV